MQRVANGLLAAGSAEDSLRFHRGLGRIPAIQSRRLLDTLHRNRDTVFGRRYGFAGIPCIEAYQERVPVADYEAFRPYVERIADGEPRVLTRERVLLLEPTGGTGGGSKWIPYTRSLKREFQTAVRAWIFDLYRRFPGLLSTRSYWSVTPVTARERTTRGGVPVGFEDDADYAGSLLGRLLKRVFAVPGEVKHIRSIDNFRYASAFYLLRAGDLGLVSVWNPTFLLLLLDRIRLSVEPLARDLFDGRLRLPEPAEESFSAETRLSPSPDRARALEHAFSGGARARYRDLWPELALISCWADGLAGEHARTVREMFPGVAVQPKGLLSTECVASFPLAAAGGSVAAYPCHFFEFLPESGDRPKLLHRLDAGEAYTLVVTTGGGLYRYNMQDRVRVTGHWRGLPVIRFEGRTHLSDLVGEKLDEGHVESVLTRVLASHGTRFRFLLFAPERTPTGGYYTLFMEPEEPLPSSRERVILESVDQGLGTNFHYRYARELGQLERPRMRVLQENTGRESYLRQCVASGQRLGDIKPVLLDRRTGWTEAFAQAERARPGTEDAS